MRWSVVVAVVAREKGLENESVVILSCPGSI